MSATGNHAYVGQCVNHTRVAVYVASVQCVHCLRVGVRYLCVGVHGLRVGVHYLRVSVHC